MLQTIDVIVEPGGPIRLLDEFHVTVPTRAVLPWLPTAGTPIAESSPEQAYGAAILDLLKTPRFAEGDNP